MRKAGNTLLASRSAFVIAFLLFFVAASHAAEIPPSTTLRLALQGPKLGQTGEFFTDPAERGMQCLALYLRDWLASTPGVLVMDAEQYRACFDEVMDASRSTHPPYSLAIFTRYTPLDAAIHWSAEDGKLKCGLCRADGERTQVFAYKNAQDLPKLLNGITDWLCAELKLDRAKSPISGALAKTKPEAIEAAYLQRHLRVVWYNTGTTKLKIMRPFMNEARTTELVARAFFEAGLQMGGRVDESPTPYIRLLCQVLPFVLGTDQEELAIRFLKSNKLENGLFESDLLEFVKAAGKSDVDQALEKLDAPDKTKALGPEIIKDTSMAAAAADNSVARQCGALRCLGAMHSAKVKPHLARAAKSDDAQVRAAVAFAWAQFDAPVGNEELTALAADHDAAVAFTAASALSARGRKIGNLADLARAVLQKNPREIIALEVLAHNGTAADAAILQTRSTDFDPVRRALALEGLVHLGSLDAGASANWLHDPDVQVVKAAIRLLPNFNDLKLSESLIALANHPDWRIAESARERLDVMLPSDPRSRRMRELATEHPYIRGQIIETLAKDESPAALDDLELATQNLDTHTRALALVKLAAKAPDRARRQLERMIADPNVWVRLHAASVAAQYADASLAAFLKTAAEAESDEAIRLYLLDAAARAEGRPLPDPKSAVNRINPDRNMSFLCGHGPDAPNSPFQGYYDLEIKPDAAAKTAHAAGKVFLTRVRTAPNPTHILLSRGWRDYCWLALDDQLLPNLSWIDGVVLGEETMGFAPFGEWDNGWRLFCREAGLDPLRVAGKKENLTDREKKAWWHWEQRLAIEGFNSLYDFIKLRYGKLRPGFVVCTFLPDQNGPCDFDRLWKFDIGAGYYYQANSRYRYTQIRRFKTLWPDRPVLWLVNGVSTSLSGQGGLKYTAKMPTTPLAEINAQIYADSVCAWLAGAHVGNFTGYLFIDKNMKDGPLASGVYVFPEDFYSGSKTLSAGIAHAFEGVEDFYRTKAAIKDLKPDIQIGKTGPADNTTLDEPATKTKDRFALQVEAEMKQMQTGFLLDAKRARDCARLLTDLPFPTHAHSILLIGDMTASKGALRLPNDYDFLDSIGHLAGQELSSYRLLAVTDSDQALLRDEVIKSVSAWLETQPGLLYIHGSLSTSPDSGLPTPGNMDGKLKEAWPWAADVSFADKQYRISGGKAVALIGEAASAKLVFWRGEGFRGGVLFDSTDLPPEELRAHLNRLFAEKQIGVKLEGPIGMEAGGVDGFRAMASCRVATEPFTLKGVDLLCGLINPALQKSRSGAIVAESYKGRFMATFNGVTILADRPLEVAEPVDGGIRIRCPGLIQAVASNGATISVQTEGAPLPTLTTDTAIDWIVYKQTPGIAEIKREGGGTVAYLRTNGAVVLKKSP